MNKGNFQSHTHTKKKKKKNKKKEREKSSSQQALSRGDRLHGMTGSQQGWPLPDPALLYLFPARGVSPTALPGSHIPGVTRGPLAALDHLPTDACKNIYLDIIAPQVFSVITETLITSLITNLIIS